MLENVPSLALRLLHYLGLSHKQPLLLSLFHLLSDPRKPWMQYRYSVKTRGNDLRYWIVFVTPICSTFSRKIGIQTQNWNWLLDNSATQTWKCSTLQLIMIIWLFYRVFLQQQDRTSTAKFQNRASTVACRGMPWQTCECNREISWDDGFTCHRELSVYAVSFFSRFEGLLLSKHSLLWHVPVSLAHSRCVNARIGSVALGIVANTGLLIFPADVFGCFQKPRSSSWQELAPRLWSALWPTPVRSLHLQATTGSLYKPFERFWNCKKTAWTELCHRQSLLAKPISVFGFRFPSRLPARPRIGRNSQETLQFSSTWTRNIKKYKNITCSRKMVIDVAHQYDVLIEQPWQRLNQVEPRLNLRCTYRAVRS